MNAGLARAAALLFLAYVLPGDRVVGMLADARAGRSPLRIEARLQARDASAPAHLVIELHPDLGERISDDRGGRWILSGGTASGRATAGTQLPAPGWVPDLAPLALRRESELRGWLAGAGIDIEQNELARCGDDDCWVLGTRRSPAQLWIEKTALELRRVVRAKQPRTGFDQWQEFGKIRFPARIELADDAGTIATLLVDSVSPANLAAADFASAWVQTAGSAKSR
ncbi:MAG TPA: hypothetical protein VEI82_04600 [Myxococcota bacterium]|nr:hypothetical protein [Myxococcota bacterium]